MARQIIHKVITNYSTFVFYVFFFLSISHARASEKHVLFFSSTVLPDMSSKSRQKTRVVKRTVNPMFNHTMVYEGFRPDDLREICVEITVWDQDHLKNYYIGGLRLGLGTGDSLLFLIHTQ